MPKLNKNVPAKFSLFLTSEEKEQIKKHIKKNNQSLNKSKNEDEFKNIDKVSE